MKNYVLLLLSFFTFFSLNSMQQATGRHLVKNTTAFEVNNPFLELRPLTLLNCTEEEVARLNSLSGDQLEFEAWHKAYSLLPENEKVLRCHSYGHSSTSDTHLRRERFNFFMLATTN